MYCMNSPQAGLVRVWTREVVAGEKHVGNRDGRRANARTSTFYSDGGVLPCKHMNAVLLPRFSGLLRRENIRASLWRSPWPRSVRCKTSITLQSVRMGPVLAELGPATCFVRGFPQGRTRGDAWDCPGS